MRYTNSSMEKRLSKLRWITALKPTPVLQKLLKNALEALLVYIKFIAPNHCRKN